MAILASQSYNELSLGDTNSDSLLLAPVKKKSTVTCKRKDLVHVLSSYSPCFGQFMYLKCGVVCVL